MRAGVGRTSRSEDGFTLLELIVVMAILGLLVVFALPAYQDATTRAKEAALRENLYQMRKSLEEHMADRGRYPETLDELVEVGYLRQIPVDPITGSSETWEVEMAPWQMVDQGQPSGIWDVYSGADGDSLDGVPYSEW